MTVHLNNRLSFYLFFELLHHSTSSPNDNYALTSQRTIKGEGYVGLKKKRIKEETTRTKQN